MIAPIDFVATRRALEALAKAEGFGSRPFLDEALCKLDQLHWLCERIAYAEGEAAAIDWREGKHDAYWHPSVIELKTLTEAFYYLAWRLIVLLDRDDGPVPSARALRTRCKGIRTIRNKLLEHPEGADSRIHVPAMVFGSRDGPQLKVVAELKTDETGRLMFKTNSPELFDAGLWANARELKLALDEMMER